MRLVDKHRLSLLTGFMPTEAPIAPDAPNLNPGWAASEHV
ncbi:hypothetical protein X762_12510 [Mesorhizobium sp. LSHC426A00]|nr:hypothetical protein X762_12510 [Mesorhizobium sp. LSHC426A00]